MCICSKSFTFVHDCSHSFVQPANCVCVLHVRWIQFVFSLFYLFRPLPLNLLLRCIVATKIRRTFLWRPVFFFHNGEHLVRVYAFLLFHVQLNEHSVKKAPALLPTTAGHDDGGLVKGHFSLAFKKRRAADGQQQALFQA